MCNQHIIDISPCSSCGQSFNNYSSNTEEFKQNDNTFVKFKEKISALTVENNKLKKENKQLKDEEKKILRKYFQLPPEQKYKDKLKEYFILPEDKKPKTSNALFSSSRQQALLPFQQKKSCQSSHHQNERHALQLIYEPRPWMNTAHFGQAHQQYYPH